MTASNGVAISGTARDARRAVFLHTGWRTAGTWLWARFRALSWVEAYHEPLHEILDTLTADTVLHHRADSWASGHPALTLPYYHEYAPLLRTTGGVQGIHANFATEDFFADTHAASPALHAYLTQLLDHATGRGREPVLKFCCSLGRVGWMQQVFPRAVHMVMLRNPASQFASARHYLAHENTPYFLVIPLAVLLRNRGDDRVADALRISDVRPPSLPAGATLDDTLRACATWIDKMPVEQWYRGFMAFWLLGVTSPPDTVDRFIDSDLLTLAPAYRTRVRSDLVALTGLPIVFDRAMTTIRLHNGIGVSPDIAWRRHQTAAMLLAARYGADWATTPNGHRSPRCSRTPTWWRRRVLRARPNMTSIAGLIFGGYGIEPSPPMTGWPPCMPRTHGDRSHRCNGDGLVWPRQKYSVSRTAEPHHAPRLARRPWRGSPRC